MEERKTRKGRSPNYPQLGLAEALEKARAVYAAEHFHAATREIVAADMGYHSLNGASLTALAALRHYGLLQNDGDGLRISDDAVALIELPRDNEEWIRAFLSVAFHPPLFGEMAREFGDTLPSEANLRHWLIKRGYLPKAADDVIRVYRENLEIAPHAVKEYDWGMFPPATKAPATPVHPSPVTPKVPSDEQQTRPYSFALSSAKRAELQIVGEGPLSADELETLRDYVEITIRALARAAKEQTGDN